LEIGIIIVGMLPLIGLKKIKIVTVPKSSFLTIFLFQLMLFLLFNCYKPVETFLPGLFLTNLFLYLIVNSVKKEVDYPFWLVETKPNLLKDSLSNLLLGTLIIVFRNITLVFVFKTLFSLICLFPLKKGTLQLINSVFSLEVALIMFLLMIEWLLYLIRISIKQFLFLAIIIICLGLFDLRWWVAISILVSMIVFAFSKQFILYFLQYNFTKKEQVFYKFLLPYISLIIYMTLVFVKDVLPDERAYIFFKIMDTITFTSAATKPPSIFIQSFFDMFLEISFFLLIWTTSKSLLRRTKIFVPAFFVEFNKAEKTALKLFKRVFKKDAEEKANG